MKKRKELKSIAHGLINSFISRNNDVNGYWGIGKLYSHMLFSKTLTIKVDLMKKSIRPCSIEFKNLIEQYSGKMYEQIENKRIDVKFLNRAEIIITAYPNDRTPSFRNMASNRMSCKLMIEDDLSRKYASTAEVWCREHNPKVELKSARVYLD